MPRFKLYLSIHKKKMLKSTNMKYGLSLVFAMIMVGEGKSILWRRLHEFNGKRVLNEVNIQKCSKILCAIFCQSNEGCLSFFYNVNDSLCYLHHSTYTNDTPSFPDGGCEYYLSLPPGTIQSSTTATTTTTPTTTTTTTTTPTPIVCPTSSHYRMVSSLCFRVVYSSKNWANSRLNCQNDGGDLIILDSQLKIDAIMPYIDTNTEYLTGMFNINGQNDFELADGRTPQDFTFRAWAVDEPSSSAGPSPCGRFKQYKWIVGSCTVSRQSLCEVK